LLIQGDRITLILDPSIQQLQPADSVSIFAGLTVYPGFIDVHIHGALVLIHGGKCG